jgi:tight adherence protein B
MEVAVPAVILALMIGLGLLFYERSRRDDVAGQEILRRRMTGGSTTVTSEAQPAVQTKQARQPVSYLGQLLRPLERWVAQAGLEMPAQQFILLTLLSGVAALLLTALWVKVGIACVYGAVVSALPVVYIIIARRRRLKTFSQQLPYVADFLRSALRAGHPLARGLQMAAENAPEPIATELRLVIDQMRYGSSLADALDTMFKRVPEESLGFFVAAIRVQAQVGSSLAEILDRVAEAIRDRQRLQQQLKALTAQSRMSALIVGALPVVMLAVFTVLRPEYMELLFYDPIGIKMLEGAIVLDLTAFFIMHRMVRV